MLEFNDVYMLKQNPTDTMRVYMSAKQDRGINVILPKNEKSWKQCFFYFSSRLKIVDSDERLIRSSWIDTKLMI